MSNVQDLEIYMSTQHKFPSSDGLGNYEKRHLIQNE